MKETTPSDSLPSPEHLSHLVPLDTHTQTEVDDLVFVPKIDTRVKNPELIPKREKSLTLKTKLAKSAIPAFNVYPNPQDKINLRPSPIPTNIKYYVMQKNTSGMLEVAGYMAQRNPQNTEHDTE